MGKPKKNIRKRLIHHHRWMLVDDDTHEAKFTLRVNLINTLLVGAFLTILLFLLAFLVLKYSPLKSYFVEESGLDEIQYKKEILRLQEQISAIEDSLSINDLYLSHMQKVITGNLQAEEVDSLMAKQSPVLLNDAKLKASAEDSIFREQIAKEELEALKNMDKNEGITLLFPPLRGIITASYDITENHLATDIAAPIGESIKSTADGTVVFADWNPETGNTIIIEHKNDMMSMYKHCSKVFKKVGDEVQKGDVIAAVGNTGELTTGPHLHFELWIQGKAVDAEQYIDF